MESWRLGLWEDGLICLIPPRVSEGHHKTKWLISVWAGRFSLDQVYGHWCVDPVCL